MSYSLTPEELSWYVCEKRPLSTHPGFAISRRYDGKLLHSHAHGPDVMKCRELADADMRRIEAELKARYG